MSQKSNKSAAKIKNNNLIPSRLNGREQVLMKKATSYIANISKLFIEKIIVDLKVTKVSYVKML